MNRTHRIAWKQSSDTPVNVAETPGGAAHWGLTALGSLLMMSFGSPLLAQPTGGVVSAGAATIGGVPAAMVITQTTPNVAINWQSFGIQSGQSVQFVQPGTNSVALNRVVGPDPSNIMGSLSSNGRVFLVNPNGILFGAGASVNVGSLVASSLAISDTDFMANRYVFSGAGPGAVQNQGVLQAATDGHLALLGANVSNEGLMFAYRGTVALAAGNAMTLDMAGDRLLSVTVNEGVVNALVTNSGDMVADGGRVLMTTQAAGSLLANAVNNTGYIQARTIANDEGSIRLLGGMETGTVALGALSTMDASAGAAIDGGFIETSAARVDVSPGASITTQAPGGAAGEWLVGSRNFTIENLPAANMTATHLSALLVTNNVTISTVQGGGDIEVNDAVAWTASSSPTTLSLNAGADVNILAPITATNGNLSVCCGQDIDVAVGADITTTNGSVLLSAGRDIRLQGALTTTNGNVTMCAGNDVLIDGTITLTHTTSITAGQDLGLPLGLVLSAGHEAGAPGAGGGTVVFAPTSPATVTNAPTTIIYNPVSYTAPTNYALNIIGAAPVQRMLVFANAQDKVADGTNAATISSVLQGQPVGDVSLVAGMGSTALFENAAAGSGKTVTLTGYSLGGADAAQYALAGACCGPMVSRTRASIAAAPVAAPAPTPAPQPSPALPVVVVPEKTGTLASGSPTHFMAPSFLPDTASSSYVLKVVPSEPLPPTVLVAARETEKAAVPLTIRRAPPAAAPPPLYKAPVRKPKAARN
jgi:filamentous hemagglutinin family protein